MRSSQPNSTARVIPFPAAKSQPHAGTPLAPRILHDAREAIGLRKLADKYGDQRSAEVIADALEYAYRIEAHIEVLVMPAVDLKTHALLRRVLREAREDARERAVAA
jgi:hypothetical protein